MKLLDYLPIVAVPACLDIHIYNTGLFVAHFNMYISSNTLFYLFMASSNSRKLSTKDKLVIRSQ